MNTDDSDNVPQNTPLETAPASTGDPIVDIMEELASIDPNAPGAELNSSRMLDGDGKPIELVDDPGATPESIKK